MKTMIIDTSSDLLYISFVDGEKEIYNIILKGKNNHSDHLIELIEKGLKETKLKVADFDQIITGVGPGSYTGIRLSLSVAKMFAWTAKIPLYTSSSLDILSSGYLTDNQVIITSLKAKKNYVYTNVLEYRGGMINRLVDDVYLSDDEFENNIISQFSNYLLVTNDYKFNCFNIINSNHLSLIEDIHVVVPNYLRGVF